MLDVDKLKCIAALTLYEEAAEVRQWRWLLSDSWVRDLAEWLHSNSSLLLKDSNFCRLDFYIA